jgi:hypothetical protein
MPTTLALRRVAWLSGNSIASRAAPSLGVKCKGQDMQLVSPRLIRGLTTQLASNVVAGDIDTAAKLIAMNAALATPGLEAFIFDRGFNLTDRAISANSNLFRIPAGIIVEGNPANALDMSMMDNFGMPKYLFRCDGSSSIPYALTANVALGDEVLTIGAPAMTALALAPGDKVELSSDRVFITGATPGATNCGEIITVTAVSATGFEFMPPAQDSYAVADVSVVRKLGMITGLRMNGVRGIGPGQFSSDTEGDRFLHLIYTDNALIDGCTSDFFDNGSYVYGMIDSRVQNFRFQFDPKGTNTVNQYGFCYIGPCQDLQIDSTSGFLGKHGVVQSDSSLTHGVTRRVKVSNSSIFGTWNYGIATHTAGEQLEFLSNRIQACGGGIEIGCRSVTTRDNEIRFLADASLGIGLGVSEVPEYVTCDNDRVFGGLYGFRLNTTSFPPLAGSIGPVEINVSRFFASSFSQAGLEIASALPGPFFNVHLADIRTRSAGLVEGGATTFAPSIRVDGPFNRVTIVDVDLQAHTGNTSACIVTAAIDSGRVRGCDYSIHSAPVLGGTDVTSVNVASY